MDALSAKLLEYKSESLDGSRMIASFVAAVQAVQVYGRAQPGDRTILDALIPAADALTKSAAQSDLKSVLTSMADIAHKSADATVSIEIAHSGRSSYLSAETIRGIPDPGAIAAAVILRAISSAY